MKYGCHFVGGIQILLDFIDSGSKYSMEHDMGVNDVYLTFEARYNWINNFGGIGMNLSSMVYSFGILFEY